MFDTKGGLLPLQQGFRFISFCITDYFPGKQQ